MNRPAKQSTCSSVARTTSSAGGGITGTGRHCSGRPLDRRFPTTTVFAKLEAVLQYTSRELPNDPCISALIAKDSESVRDPRVHRAALEAIGSVVEDGRCSGQVRNDLDTDELVDYMVEQTYFAAEDPKQSEDEVRRRFRHFIVPVLIAPSSMSAERATWTLEIQDTVQSVIRQLKDQTDQLPAGAAHVGSADTD